MRFLRYAIILAFLSAAGFFGYRYIEQRNSSHEDITKAENSVKKKPSISKDLAQKQEISKKNLPKKEDSKTLHKDKKIADSNSYHYTKKPKVVPKDAVVVELPKVPKVEAKVPQVITVGSKVYEHKQSHHRLSTTMPEPKKEPIKKETKKSQKQVKSDVGEAKLGRISTYMRGSFIPKDEVIKRLKDGGFTIVSDTLLDKEGDLEVVVFSDDILKKLALKSPYLASMRVLIDKKNKEISISNPLYFSKAFMGSSFDLKSAMLELHKISAVFNSLKLKDSKDMLKDTLISKYQFMFGMPYYEDMITVAKGKAENLVKRAKKSKRISFIQDLGNGKVLIGMKLSSKTGSFIKATGEKNALLLPYPIVIDGDEAKILNPKYYIAISYPMLKMSQFMKISDIPDAIEAEAKAVFK
jgi:hypothetical protein